MPFRLSCLTAHPDDEAGGFAAALLTAAKRGITTATVCLTEGAAGSYREPGQTDEQLAALRRNEFAAACEALHVGQSELLSFPDGQLWQQPFLSLVEPFVRHIRSFRPHVVLTFGADGSVNVHRDHTMVSLAATAAFHWSCRSLFFPEHLSGDQPLSLWAPQKLYYSSPQFLSTADPEAQGTTAQIPSSLVFELSEELLAEKLAAFSLHASQRGVLERVQAEHAQAMAREAYLLAATRHPASQEQDIWDGVTEDE